MFFILQLSPAQHLKSLAIFAEVPLVFIAVFFAGGCGIGRPDLLFFSVCWFLPGGTGGGLFLFQPDASVALLLLV